MSVELTARTEEGGHLVALAESLAGDFATRAADHDRSATYPFASIAALRKARYFGAPVPIVHGGMGVSSVHDLLVAASRLARGDASVAIGVNMHMAVLRNIVRRWEMAVAAADGRRARAFAHSMQEAARGDALIATAVSELGQDLTRPATTATKTDGGWRIDGRKAFCTMSPAATVLYTAVTFANGRGERYGYARIPSDAPGVTILDDWDALGMRASGTNTVSFEGVQLPDDALKGGFAIGDAVAYMESNLNAGLFHASASLGIAEVAFESASRAVRDPGDGQARMQIADAAVDLTAARSALAHAATLVDDHYADNPAASAPAEELTALFTEAQTAKAFINAAAVRVVDRALALSGGAGYRNGHPLARAYRDVRAGAFMHPLGTNRAYDLIADVALGREPALH
jgi:alkylation response protein AidB-like acyl-CoA dehydrogenase